MSNEERFTDINPEDLPPELQAVYKSLQRDYTKKRQSDATKAKEAEEKAAKLEEQIAKQTQFIDQAQDYIVSLETANTDWQRYFDSNKDKLEQKPSEDPKKMSKKDEEILKTDKRLLSKEDVGELDTYFEEKYGKTFSELTTQVQKLTTQLKFGQQLSDIDRSYGQKLKAIDRDKIIKRAIERGDGDAFKAFDDVYGGELKEIEFAERLEKEKAKWEEETKAKVMTGVTSAHKPSIYVRPEGTPRTYEEASDQIAAEVAAGG